MSKINATDDDMKGPFPDPYRTGGWVVVRDEFLTRNKEFFGEKFTNSAIENRFAFITDEVWDIIKLPRSS